MPDRSAQRRSASRAPARPPSGGGRRWLPLALAALIALILFGGLLWVNRGGTGLDQAQVEMLLAARTKGAPNAPVLVEEWGDFQ